MVVSTSKASNTYTAFARNRSGNGQLLSLRASEQQASIALLYERSSLQPLFVKLVKLFNGAIMTLSYAQNTSVISPGQAPDASYCKEIVELNANRLQN